MAVYCKNHVDEEVERLSKLGSVKKTPTKEGTCGHLGGCNTDNLNLVELTCDYGKAPKEEAPRETPAEGVAAPATSTAAGDEASTTEVTETTSDTS